MITHNQALIIFWSLVGLMITGFIFVGLGVYFDLYFEPVETWALISTVLSLLFFPVIILIPLIGSGYFERREITK